MRVFLCLCTCVCMWYGCAYVSIYTGVEQNKETPGNFNQIYFNMLFWLQPSREIRPCAVPLLQILRKLSSRGGHSAQLFRAVFLWSFLTIRPRVRRSLSDGFRFIPEFCFSEEVFLLSQLLSTFETVLLAKPNNSALFVTLVPVLRAPTIWPLCKSDRSATLISFDLCCLMIIVKKQQF